MKQMGAANLPTWTLYDTQQQYRSKSAENKKIIKERSYYEVKVS
jgi:hypothetical protein